MIPDPEPTFDRLSDALVGKHAAKATVDQIRQLFVSEGMNVAEELRPELWSRIVCNKTLTGLQASSVDSYCKWQASADIDSFTDERSVWIKLEAGILAERITCMPQDEAERLHAARQLHSQFYRLVTTCRFSSSILIVMLQAGIGPSSKGFKRALMRTITPGAIPRAMVSYHNPG
ncbi:hypothetical protein MHU86_25209 [Fragilaria crotonensis]|nr:hypothetical protein MHU86_25209 [Fragilaria crotonensis]